MSVYKRGGVWWVKFQRNGEIFRQPAHTSSRRVAKKYEQQIKEEHGRLSRGGKPRRTFDDLMARFVREHFPNLKHSSARRYEVSIKNLAVHFDGRYLDEIDRRSLADFVSARKRVVSGASVRRDLACLSSAFGLAVDWDWIDINPVSQLKKRNIPESAPRTRYLTREEYQRLLPHTAPYLAPMISFAVATGLRLEEQLSLEWGQVNLQRRELTLTDTKSGTPRIIPLTGEAMAALQESPQHYSSPYVFHKADGSRYGKLTRGLAGAAHRAEINDLRWHDLRRTCGSWMLQAGTPMEVVKKWLGHKSIVVTERSYAFLDNEALHRAAQTGTITGTWRAD